MKRILLVVDDEVDIGRLFERYLKDRFDEVHVVTTVAEAERILGNAGVTHVVVDHYLGRGEPLGMEAVVRWREEWPGIRYAALFTGSQITLPSMVRGIDDIFYKPSGFDALVTALSS